MGSRDGAGAVGETDCGERAPSSMFVLLTRSVATGAQDTVSRAAAGREQFAPCPVSAQYIEQVSADDIITELLLANNSPPAFRLRLTYMVAFTSRGTGPC
eukprot:scaffold32939_cov30-Tisochrysis_lutea.AAC.2